MNWKWDAELKPDMRANPVVMVRAYDLDALRVPTPSDEELETVFKSAAYKLQTWNRSRDEKGKIITADDPHWLAVRNGTPLHIDPAYPRYSYQLKVRVDPGIVVRGVDKVEMPLERGTFYVLDTHSPHQVLCKGDGAWNVTASCDMPELVDDWKAMVKRLVEYAIRTPILQGVPA